MSYGMGYKDLGMDERQCLALRAGTDQKWIRVCQ